jgi:hypothetical protein
MRGLQNAWECKLAWHNWEVAVRCCAEAAGTHRATTHTWEGHPESKGTASSHVSGTCRHVSAHIRHVSARVGTCRHVSARVGTCPARVGTYPKSPFEDKRPKWRKGRMMAERCHFDGSRGQSVLQKGRRWYWRRSQIDADAPFPSGRVGQGALSRFSGGVAQNVRERICIEQGVFAIQRGVCTERVGTYAYRGAFPHLAGRVARNVSEGIVFI